MWSQWFCSFCFGSVPPCTRDLLIQFDVSGACAILEIMRMSFPPAGFLPFWKECSLFSEKGRIRREPPCLYSAQYPQSPQVQTSKQEVGLARHKFTHLTVIQQYLRICFSYWIGHHKCQKVWSPPSGAAFVHRSPSS